MLAQNFAQSSMQKVRGCVISHGRFPNIRTHDRVDLVPYPHVFLRDNLVSGHALDWVITTCDLGNDGVVIVGVQPAAISHLAARLRVEGSVIEDHLALLAGLEFLNSLPVAEQRQNFAPVRTRLTVDYNA